MRISQDILYPRQISESWDILRISPSWDNPGLSSSASLSSNNTWPQDQAGLGFRSSRDQERTRASEDRMMVAWTAPAHQPAEYTALTIVPFVESHTQ